jgi:hypothetical protein
MLNSKLLNDLKTQRADVSKLLDQTSRSIGEVTDKRRAKLDRAVVTILPQVSKKVLAYLNAEYPDFLTADRVELFEKHGVILGIFNRATTKSALDLLQAQFAAFLATTDYCAEEDELLRNLANQKSRLARELELVSQLLRDAGMPSGPGTAAIPRAPRRFQQRSRSSGGSGGVYIYDTFQPNDDGDDLLSTVLYIEALEALNNQNATSGAASVQFADGGSYIQPDAGPALDLSNPVLCEQDVNGNVDCAPIDVSGNQGDACLVTDDSLGAYS